MTKRDAEKNVNFPKILRIIRVHIALGGFLAFSLGALLAIVTGGSFNPSRVALFYAVVFFGDLSTHFSNDYFDVEVDKHVKQKKLFSGSHILVDNPQVLPLARTISITLLILSIGIAGFAVLFWAAPIELLVITLGANFLGWFYSAPPLRLVSKGLGEVAIAVAVGFAIPASGYLSVNGVFDSWFAFFVLPFLLYGFMLSLSLEAPDIEVDPKGDKKSMGVRKGERFVFSLVLAVSLAASLLFTFYALQGSSLILDFRAIAGFSIAPLSAGLVGFVNVMQKRKMSLFSTLNVVSLFIFNILTVAYLTILAFAV